jgi:poly(3-hydroxyalkanoate) synthetase
MRYLSQTSYWGERKMKMNFVVNQPKAVQKTSSVDDFNLTDALNKSSSYLKKKKGKVKVFQTTYSNFECGSLAGKMTKASN